MKCKPEPEVVFGAIWRKTDFLGFSRAKISVAMGVTRPVFRAISYVWGLNIRGKFQGRSSRASYICQVSYIGILGVSAQYWGGLLPAASPLGPKFLRRYVLRNSVYECGKFGFCDSFRFGDMKAPILRFVQWRCRHRACLSALRVVIYDLVMNGYK